MNCDCCEDDDNDGSGIGGCSDRLVKFHDNKKLRLFRFAKMIAFVQAVYSSNSPHCSAKKDCLRLVRADPITNIKT